MEENQPPEPSAVKGVPGCPFDARLLVRHRAREERGRTALPTVIERWVHP